MLRQFVFDMLSGDPQLNSLGYNASTMYGVGPDNPTARRFMVLRWGSQGARPGRDTAVRSHALTVWAYDRDPDYAAITSALSRVCSIMSPIDGASHGSGVIVQVVDNGSSDDLYDPAYEASTRNWTFSIIASES